MQNLPISAAVEIVASDLQRSLEFYRLIGLAIPETDGPHVEVELPVVDPDGTPVDLFASLPS